MSRLTQRRFVFLDVDGLLIPLRTRPVASGRRSGGVRADLEGASGNPVLDRLDPQDGRRLLALDCPLVWATSWMGEANEVIAPRLGLPDLPVVEWPDTDDQPAPGLHWKTMFPHRRGGRSPVRMARRRAHRRGSQVGRRTPSGTRVAAPSRSIPGPDRSRLRTGSPMAG